MGNEIKLLKNNDNRTDSDLDKVVEFYEFLQGNSPKCINDGKPLIKLSKNKAFNIIWYLQEHFSIIPDHIEKCSICGDLYGRCSAGYYSEKKGKFYCGSCDSYYNNED